MRWVPANSWIVSSSGSALAWLMAQRRDPCPAIVAWGWPSDTFGSAMKMASVPAQASCSCAVGARLASIAPLRYSSVQLPSNCAAPVRSVLAATSAPVSSARSRTSCWPTAVWAKSQPYSSRSASPVSARDHDATWSARASRVCPSSRALPSSIWPSLPCASTCTAETSLRPASVSVIRANPSWSAAIVMISIARPLSRCAFRSSSSVCASGTDRSTKTISLLRPTASFAGCCTACCSAMPPAASATTSGARSAECRMRGSMVSETGRNVFNRTGIAVDQACRWRIRRCGIPAWRDRTGNSM